LILEQQGLARLPGRDRLTAFQPILKILKMTFKPAGYQPQNRAAADGSFSVLASSPEDKQKVHRHSF